MSPLWSACRTLSCVTGSLLSPRLFATAGNFSTGESWLCALALVCKVVYNCCMCACSPPLSGKQEFSDFLKTYLYFTICFNIIAVSVGLMRGPATESVVAHCWDPFRSTQPSGLGTLSRVTSPSARQLSPAWSAIITGRVFLTQSHNLLPLLPQTI